MFWIDGQELGVGRLFLPFPTAKPCNSLRYLPDPGTLVEKCSWRGLVGVAWQLLGWLLPSQGKDAAAVADVRKGFERIHGWQTSGLSS